PEATFCVPAASDPSAPHLRSVERDRSVPVPPRVPRGVSLARGGRVLGGPGRLGGGGGWAWAAPPPPPLGGRGSAGAARLGGGRPPGGGAAGPGGGRPPRGRPARPHRPGPPAPTPLRPSPSGQRGSPGLDLRRPAEPPATRAHPGGGQPALGPHPARGPPDRQPRPRRRFGRCPPPGVVVRGPHRPHPLPPGDGALGRGPASEPGQPGPPAGAGLR